MQTPLEITFQDLQPSSLVEQRIREYVQELEPYFDQIIRCHVTVAPHVHYRQGQLYFVRVDVRLADGAVVVGHDRPGEHAHEDLRIAMRDTFADVKERLRARTVSRRSA